MMRLAAQWNLAWRNLGRNRRRNALGVLTIGVSIASVCLVSAQGYRVERFLTVNAAYNNYFGYVSVYKRQGLERHLIEPREHLIGPDEQIKLGTLLAGLPEVEFTGRYFLGAGLASNGCESVPFVATGIDTEIEERLRQHPTLTRWNSLADVPPPSARLVDGVDAGAVSLTPELARGLSKVLPATSGLSFEAIADCASPAARAQISADPGIQLLVQDAAGDTRALDARIVGQHSTGRMFTEDVGMRASLSFMQKLFATQGITYLAVFLKDGTDIPPFLERLQNAVARDLGGEFVVYSGVGEELNPLDNGTIKWHHTIEWFAEILIAAVIAVIVTNFLSMVIIDRRREMGTMAAIGFRTGDIVSILQKESTLIMLIGAIFGTVLAAAAILVINHASILYRPPGVVGRLYFHLAVDAPHLVARLVVVMALALLSVFLFARHVAKKTSVAELLIS